MPATDIEIIDTHVHAEPWFCTIDEPVPPPDAFDSLYADCRRRTRLVTCVTGKNPVLAEAGNIAAVERLADLLKPFPDKFIGAVMVNPHDVDSAVAAVELAVTTCGFRLVGEMVQYIHNYRTDGPEAVPVVAKAVELDVPVMYHVSSSDQAERIARLAEAFPAGRFLAAHYAGGREGRRGLEVVRPLANISVEIMRPSSDEQVAAVLDAVGPRRITYGTDFGLHGDPELRYTSGNDLLDRLDRLGLPAADVDAICSGNARRLMELDD